ncbi:protein O-linked-mannose beta-1,2-N-acetylglucosaminyltransferase 1-like [Branchiostoma lanceolatum]|uniref:protein O-linked-mannose beta-1,2-N-acetylglucosaminyltransferase 1-like n=1 Tax=Branchiostoma lanceolatum TaxID=7740 RepID=UPI0034564212
MTPLGGRGHQAYILNERTGDVLDKASFDTYAGGGGAAAARQVETFLEGVAEGRIIAIVVHDTGDSPVNLAPYGSKITHLGLRESYAMITQKGETPYWFVERKSAIRAGPTIVETIIPVSHRLTVTTSAPALSGTTNSLTVEIFSDVCDDVCATTTVSGLTANGTEYDRDFAASNFGDPSRLRLTSSGSDRVYLDWYVDT